MVQLRKLGIQLSLLRPRGEMVFANVVRTAGVPESPRSILFYFPDPVLMHLGDHLFWEPALRHLRASGHAAAVLPAPAMRGYFESLGHPVAEPSDLGTFDLIATRVEFLYDPALAGRPVVYFKQKQPYPGKPYCQLLTEQLCILAQLPPPTAFPPPARFREPPPGPALDPGERYLVFNNYIDSGSFRLNSRDRQRLLAACAELRRSEGLEVLHVGSAGDAAGDRTAYPFPRIDLRGRTTVPQLFALFAHPQVVQSLSFDTFPAHLAMLHGKKANILQRRSWPRTEFESVRTCFLPPFPPVAGYPPVQFLD